MCGTLLSYNKGENQSMRLWNAVVKSSPIT